MARGAIKARHVEGSLEGVLAVVRLEREQVIRQKERELRNLDYKISGSGAGSGGGRNGPREIDMMAD
jgi:ribosomal protein S6